MAVCAIAAAIITGETAQSPLATLTVFGRYFMARLWLDDPLRSLAWVLCGAQRAYVDAVIGTAVVQFAINNAGQEEEALMWSKTTAGILLALPITVFFIGALALLWPGEQNELILVWLIFSFPVWVAVLAVLPLQRRRRDSWYGYVGLTLLGALLVLSIKYVTGGGS